MRPLSDYIGLPILRHGRDFTGVDCYGLVWLWHRENRYRTLPDFRNDLPGEPTPGEVANVFEAGRSLPAFKRVDDPQNGDIIFLRINGLPSHCGLVIGIGRFLHVSQNHASSIEYWTAPAWADRVIGFYRYTGDSA